VSIHNFVNRLSMAELRKADAERLLEFVGDAHTVDGPEAFTTELLDRLGEAMSSEFVTYMEFDAESPAAPPLVTVLNSRQEHYVALRWPHRPPHVPRFASRPLGHVDLWSDYFERATRWGFERAPWTKTFEVVDSAQATLPAGGSQRGVVALFRQGRDFNERDRRALSLGAWFEGRVSRLPSLIEEWLRSGEGRKALRIERNGTRLVVEAPTSRALLLTEERVIRATLTAREVEVLRWLAAGKSTSEIARELWVTPATVSKHLHHIYRKLGVTSRTAALAATSRYAVGMLDGPKSSTSD
jgi:DNA-binding CsgD family transcriptional regulator